MEPVPPRTATLVLVGEDGRALGRLPALPLTVPWWAEASPIVDAARDTYGIDIVVLRMLDSERPRPHGGGVTYLAEVRGPWPLPEATARALAPADWEPDDQALRMPWARPGGPAADLAWAEGSLTALGLTRDGPARQVRTWNLSSIWELPLADGSRAWLKVVPPFFAHEGSMLRALAGGPVPRLLDDDGARVLLAEVPGEDLYNATLPELLALVAILVGLQAGWVPRVDELLGMGLPDWREPALSASIRAVVERRGGELDAERRRVLARLVDGLPDRFAALASCGLPDTLVHGDFHPGNTRGVPGRTETLVLLDWGDSGVGNPLLDLPPFLGVLAPEQEGPVRAHWLEAWQAAAPGSDPVRAAGLIAPIAAARQAVLYQAFVDAIEPVERRHHDADAREWLERTADLLDGG